jgi:hypothetical protein
MLKKSLLLLAAASLALAACGSTDAAVATAIAQTQQISQLETAAAGGSLPTATPAAAGSTATPAASSVTTSRDVNMRAGDSTSYGVMTVIPGGEVLEVIGINAAGTWYQVRYHEAIGWVSLDFTTGDAPTGLPVATPSAAPQAGGGGGGSSGGGGGGTEIDYEDYFLALDVNDDQNRSVSGEVGDDAPVRITIDVDFHNQSGDYEVDIAFQCDTDEPERMHITAAGATDNTICNNNWSHAVDPGHRRITIFLTWEGGGSPGWTLIANVGED